MFIVLTEKGPLFTLMSVHSKLFLVKATLTGLPSLMITPKPLLSTQWNPNHILFNALNFSVPWLRITASVPSRILSRTMEVNIFQQHSQNILWIKPGPPHSQLNGVALPSPFWNHHKGRNPWLIALLFRWRIYVLVNYFLLIYPHFGKWAVGPSPCWNQKKKCISNDWEVTLSLNQDIYNMFCNPQRQGIHPYHVSILPGKQIGAINKCNSVITLTWHLRTDTGVQEGLACILPIRVGGYL